MKGRSLFALSVLSLVLACEGNQQPTGPNAPSDASGFIGDGAHNGGNPDFFFLQPLVANPAGDADYEPGKFNNAIGPSLTVEICRLEPDIAVDGQHLPTSATPCYKNGPVDKFPAGTVHLVNHPASETGWWTGLNLNLPADGFYYVVWNTLDAHLNPEKFYRVKVFISGSNVPLGVVDIDPMKRLREYRPSLEGQVVQVLDDEPLPIPFRVEKGALCNGGTCNSATITGTSLTGPQSVIVDAGGGSIAGALFSNGWLPTPAQCPDPSNCPQSVVVTVTEVNTAGSGLPGEPTICHPALSPRLIQFRGCFNYTTTPTLRPFNAAGDQFAAEVMVAVCFELEGTNDPRRDFAELYASGPNEPPHALTDERHEGVLVATKDCTNPPIIITQRSSNPLVQLASTGWRKLKGGLDGMFSVKTAHAVDLGLGGIVKGFSNISPVLSSNIQAYGPTTVTFEGGLTVNLSATITGNHHHLIGEEEISGINLMPVKFSVAAGNGILRANDNANPTDTVTVNTANLTIQDGDGFTIVPGIAIVSWTPPSIPGTYHMTATGAATGGPVTYTAIVTQPPLVNIEGTWDNEVQAGANVSQLILSVTGLDVTSIHAYGNCVPTLCDWGSENADESRWNGFNELSTVFHDEVATRTVTINYLSASRIKVSITAVFNNGSGQYSTVEYFRRVT